MNPIRQAVAKERYEEVQSDLFRESGVNATTSGSKIAKYDKAMQKGWGRFPAVHGTISRLDRDDLERYDEAAEGGYEHELAWSRAPTRADIGKLYVHIEDGHNRAHAARQVGIPIRVKVW